MDNQPFQRIDRYMVAFMEDSAYDRDHIYRVLYAELDIANHENDVNMDLSAQWCLPSRVI